MSRPVGLIVGTGVDSVQLLSDASLSSIKTPFGDVSYMRGSIGDADVCVLKRHGEGHVVPPHLINYRANICLLYTSDAADDLLCVDLGGRRIIKKKKKKKNKKTIVHSWI